MSNKWALVTGATSGIGKATALTLLQNGWGVHAWARRRDRLDALVGEAGAWSGQLQTLEVDVADPGSLEHAFVGLGARAGEIDVLVNNAGLALGTDKAHEGKLEDWDQMIDVNVKGLLHVTRAMLPHFVRNKRGHVVNIGSVAGRWTYPGGAVYAASKHAVRAFSEGLRMDLAGTGVRVTNIEPGMVNTEFSEVRFGGDKERADKVYAGMTPLSAQDIADCVLWSLQRPAHINIQELVVFPTDQAAIGQVHRR